MEGMIAPTPSYDYQDCLKNWRMIASHPPNSSSDYGGKFGVQSDRVNKPAMAGSNVKKEG